MTTHRSINRSKRQPYFDEEAYEGTLKLFTEDEIILQQTLLEHTGNPFERSLDFKTRAGREWFRFQLDYTAGKPVVELALQLSKVVEAYEQYVEELSHVPDEKYFTPFALDDLIDNYIDYVNLLSVAILLHREDLVPRIYSLIEGTDYDGDDAVIEELLNFFLPDRPSLDQWIWDKPYGLLLHAIDEPDERARVKGMKKYVKAWYPAMKGQAIFWGKHESITADFSPYYGYWAMCAAAFTYLYGLDDSTYRDELVYPKDLVDFARSTPRNPVIDTGGEIILRIVGGDRCAKEGTWFTPAQENSARHFAFGEVMPIIASSEYGTTIWQWRSP